MKTPKQTTASRIDVILEPDSIEAIAEAYVMASKLPESIFHFIESRFLSPTNLFRPDCDELTAVGAGRFTVTLRLSDGFRDLLSALRAGDLDRYLAKVETSHDGLSCGQNQ